MIVLIKLMNILTAHNQIFSARGNALVWNKARLMGPADPSLTVVVVLESFVVVVLESFVVVVLESFEAFVPK